MKSKNKSYYAGCSCGNNRCDYINNLIKNQTMWFILRRQNDIHLWGGLDNDFVPMGIPKGFFETWSWVTQLHFREQTSLQGCWRCHEKHYLRARHL